MNSEAVCKYIVHWLSDYLDSSTLNSFVVGVSGGVDSACVASLCAMTKSPTILLTLPIRQNKEEINRGLELCNKLMAEYKNVEHYDLNLDHLFDTFIATLPENSDNHLALANSRARLRMITLYGVAGNNRALVVGTGNKVEDFGIGFYTKYGDGAVDISPIADLNKTQVFSLADYLSVPASIQSAAPTDGLWDDERVDEDQIGASYNEIEWAMEYDGDRSELTHQQVKVLKIFRDLSMKNSHKFNPVPVCRIPDNTLESDSS